MSDDSAFRFCAALVEALAAHGVNHAAVSPGSRNTPLLLAISAHPGIEVSVHHDERSGAFFGLGLAKATGRPTLLCCTSGTAATEYLPALTEARMSHTPLIALTADRPPELQDRGAPQTIDQTNLYGSAAKWFFDTGVPDAGSVADAAHLGRQAVTTAVETPAGPVHLNVPLREPLVPPAPQSPPRSPSTGAALVDVPRAAASESEIRQIADVIHDKAVAVVAGWTNRRGTGRAARQLAQSLGGIVVADPQSDARFAGQPGPTIQQADLLIAAGWGATASPEAVLHLGAIHTSKPVNEWLATIGGKVIHIHDGQWQDPLGIADTVLVADPALAATDLAKLAASGDPSFSARWRRADAVAGDVLASELEDLSEPAIAHTLLRMAPANAVFVAGSSMPIRLVDSYGRRNVPARVIANRGANGIDGTVATALGVAAAGLGPTFALLGDLTALADIGSLATVARLGLALSIVVINNDGGAIFDFLPHADPHRVDPADYRELIRAPHGLSLGPIAASFGIDVFAPATLDEFAALVTRAEPGPRFIEIKTSPGSGRATRRAVVDQLRRRLD